MTTAHFRSPIARYSRPKRHKRIKSKRYTPRRGRIYDPDFLEFVKTFGCVVCYRGHLRRDGLYEINQKSETEAAHCGPKGFWQKANDATCLPLCAIEHHRVGPEAHHKLGKRFWGFYGLDQTLLISQMQELFRLNGGGLQSLGGVVRV